MIRHLLFADSAIIKIVLQLSYWPVTNMVFGFFFPSPCMYWPPWSWNVLPKILLSQEKVCEHVAPPYLSGWLFNPHFLSSLIHSDPTWESIETTFPKTMRPWFIRETMQVFSGPFWTGRINVLPLVVMVWKVKVYLSLHSLQISWISELKGSLQYSFHKGKYLGPETWKLTQGQMFNLLKVWV